MLETSITPKDVTFAFLHLVYFQLLYLIFTFTFTETNDEFLLIHHDTDC